MRLLLLATALSVLALLPACASRPEGPPPAMRVVMVSPAGELLALPGRRGGSGEAGGGEAVEAWLRAADRDGNGRLDATELAADTARFFATLDADKDGTVNSRELEEARRARREQLRAASPKPGEGQPPQGTPPEGASPEGAPPDGPRPPDGDGRRPRGRGPGDGMAGSGVDPVMSADQNLDFRVSLQELQQEVLRRLQEMDKNHDGGVDLAELEEAAKAAAERSRGGPGGGHRGNPGGPGGGRSGGGGPGGGGPGGGF